MNEYWRTLLLTLLLAGCVAQPRPGPGEGLLVVSVTQETLPPTGPFISYDVESLREYTTTFRLAGPGGQVRWLSTDGFMGARIHLEGSKPPGSRGRLQVLRLPAGEYRIDTWQIDFHTQHFDPASLPPALQFSIRPGETLYIGNLHMEIIMGSRLTDAGSFVTGEPQVRDERARDVALLAGQPPTDAGGTEVRLLPLGEWRAAEIPVEAGR